MTAAHREVPVKVTAWVDEGVAPLVLALNDRDDVVTCDSCEHAPRGGAYVLFRCRGRDGGALATELACLLSRHDGEIEYLLRAEWRPGADEPLLELACPRGQVAAIARVLSAARRMRSADDSARRAVRSWRHHFRHPATPP